MKKNLILSTIIFIASMVIMRFSGLLSKIILARLITPFEYGLITLLVISVPGLLQIFTNSFFYEIISHSKEGRKYFGFVMTYGLISSVIILTGLFLFHDTLYGFLNLPMDSWFYYWIILAISIISVTLLGNFTGLFRGLQNYAMSSFISLAPSIFRIILLLLVVYLFAVSDFKSLMFAYALPPLLVLLIIVSIKFSSIKKLFKKSIYAPPKDMLLFGAYVYLVGIFTNFMQYMNRIVISHDLGIEYQGYFDVSLSVVGVLAFSFAAMQFICVPEVTTGKDKKELLFKRGEIGDVSRALFAFMIYCIIILIIYPRELVDLLFSTDYIKSADYLYILSIGYIFLFVQQFIAYLNVSSCNNLKEHKNLLLTSILLLVILPFITHYAIQYFGFIGAYISTTAFLIVYLLITIYYLKDRSPLMVLSFKGERLIITSAATFLFLYIFKIGLILGVILSGIIYITLIFATKYLHKSIVTNMIKLKNRA